ncbi:hypothetical protein QOT17_014896 [Balamuthia mandrillaris]
MNSSNSTRPKEPVRKVIERIDNILQQMTEQPSEAQTIAALKCYLNPCLLELVSNVLLLQNAEKYDQAVQIALSVELIFMHTRLPLVPAVLYTQHPDILHNHDAQPPDILVISVNLASLQCSTLAKQRQHHLSNWLQPLPPSSPSPSPSSLLSGTNQPFTNALDASAKQEFMEAETQGNIELTVIDLNSLLHPGNAFDSATDAPSPVVTPEAICVEGLDTGDDNDVEYDCEDKVEPPIMAPILLNHQHTTVFIDSGASPSFISPAVAEKYLHPVSCEHHHTVISHIDDMEITLGNRFIRITHHVAHLCINCGSCKLHHHILIMPLQGKH